MARKRVISFEVDKLQEALRLIPGGRQVIGENLLVEIRFLAETLVKLRQAVMSDDTDISALKMYNATIQRYALLYKQFGDLLPRQTADASDNALLDFIKKP